MKKKSKEANLNLYYINGQDSKNSKSNKEKTQKNKEREKRIKQNKNNNNEKDFDLETETVIEMTNKNKIKKEQQRKKELSKKEQKRKKRNKTIKLILKIVILLAIIIGGIIFSLTSPIFNIKNIQVSNNNYISSETIISLSELKYDENIFKFNNSSVKEKIKENAYIQDVKIHRNLPDTIQIEIEERVQKYSVDFLGKYAYINNQGYILEISEDSMGLPIILGVQTPEEQIVAGNRLNNEDLIKLEDIIKITDILKENNLESEVTNIDISNKNEYSIYLEQENKKIYLGDNTNLNNKILYAIAIIEEEKGKAGDIYVNGDLNNKFQPYFKEKI